MPDVITSWGPSWAVARRFAGATFVVDQRYWSDSRGVDGLDTAGEYARADRAGSRCGAVGDAHLHSCSLRFVDGSNDIASSASQEGLRHERSALRAHGVARSEELTSELQSRGQLVCRLLL